MTSFLDIYKWMNRNKCLSYCSCDKPYLLSVFHETDCPHPLFNMIACFMRKMLRFVSIYPDELSKQLEKQGKYC